MADALPELWQQAREAISARMAVLDQAASAMPGGDLDAALRSRAEREAHKLAGLLGIFGRAEGARLAQDVERRLGGHAPLGAPDVRCIAELLARLWRELDRTPDEAMAAPAPMAEAEMVGVPILAIDDDRQVLAVIRALLQPRGVRVSTLDDPRRFWTALEETAPALVLLDIEMPHADGLALCRALRRDPRWARLPVIVVTARRDPESVAQVRAAGGDLLHKPFTGPQLLARLAAHLVSAPGDQVVTHQLGGAQAMPPGRPAAAPTDPAQGSRAPGEPHRARILLADDDDAVAKVVAIALGRAGHQVARARDGAEALHLAGQRRFDLILLDVQMPGVDGCAACRALRADPALAGVPIIMLSAQGDDTTVLTGLADGATDFLAKPFAVAHLRARVETWLEHAGVGR